MRLPRDFDAVDLLYAAHSICTCEPLNKQGLNRNGMRGARRALAWFESEIHKSVEARMKRVKRARKR